MRVGELFAFIKERHAIYERRAAGAAKPWTEDPIFQRFTEDISQANLDSLVSGQVHAGNTCHNSSPYSILSLLSPRRDPRFSRAAAAPAGGFLY
jgi:hypothetical protein